ncbi:MAG TPA: STAS domain-containing protein [Pyrinomonadaceae bacterium]|nr:STAS domain-containing protein [Pyrinomonadaceae bacterium]
MLKVHAKRFGTVAILRLQGQIVNGQMEILRNAVQFLPEISAVKLDLALVTTVDAGGLGVMLGLREQAESRGVRFELMNVNRRIGTVLALTRLDSVFRITSSVEVFPAVSHKRRTPAVALASYA